MLEKCVAIWKNVELLCFLLYSLQANLLGRRFKRVVVQKLYKNRESISIKKRGNHLNVKQLPLCGAGGIRTHVQTGKPYAFYMLILAFGFRDATRPRPPIAPLSSKTSPVRRGTHWLFPIYLHRLILRFGTTSLERCLVPPTLWRNKANLLYFD